MTSLLRMGMTIFPRTSREWRAFRGRSGRIAATALVVSGILHAFALLTVRTGRLDGVEEARPRSPSLPGSARVMEVVLVSPQRSLAPELPAPPEITTAEISGASDSRASTPLTTPTAAPPGGRPTEGGGEADPEAGGARNSLIWNGFSDMRLAAALPVLRPEEALAEVLAQPEGYTSPLRQCYDSIDARAARSRKAQDWSRRDRRGWRWGISADGIHIGPITVPVAPPRPPPGAASWRPERDPCVDR